MAATVGPKKVHRYTVEFKIQAVRLSLHPEIQTQDLAHALDIHPFMLSKWKKDYREAKLKPAAEAAGLSLTKVLRAPSSNAWPMPSNVSTNADEDHALNHSLYAR